MARILHTADIHLDSPFTSGLPLDKARLRRSEQREVFSRIIELAKQEAEVLLISGDLFDNTAVSAETTEFLKRSFAELDGMPVFISPGNHDPYTAGSIYMNAGLGDNVRIFGTDGGYEDIDSLRLRVCGIGFGSENGEGMIRPGELPLHPEYTNILVLHADMNGRSARYNPVTAEELSRFDYAALGHIHHSSSDGVWAYPGIPEPRGFDEDAGGGVIVGEVGRGTRDLRMISVAKRKYKELNVGLDDDVRDTEALTALIRNAAGDSSDIYRITLTGRTGGGFRPDVQLLTERVSDIGFYVSIYDKTRSEYDLSAAENDNSLRAGFIRSMQERLSALERDSREYRICKRAFMLGLDALEGGDSID